MPRRVAILAAVIALSGCMEDVPQAASAEAPSRVVVADGTVIVAGPDGYCVDLEASRDASAGAFVVLGSCAAIAGNPALPQPQRPAVLTATVSGPGGGAPVSDSLPALDSYFRSDAGRAALARSGRAENVTILQGFSRDGAYILRLRDVSGFSGPALEPDYWRAVVDVGDRIVTLSVLAPRGKAHTAEEGLAILTAYLRRIRAENRGTFAYYLEVPRILSELRDEPARA